MHIERATPHSRGVYFPNVPPPLGGGRSISMLEKQRVKKLKTMRQKPKWVEYITVELYFLCPLSLLWPLDLKKPAPCVYRFAPWVIGLQICPLDLKICPLDLKICAPGSTGLPPGSTGLPPGPTCPLCMQMCPLGLQICTLGPQVCPPGPLVYKSAPGSTNLPPGSTDLPPGSTSLPPKPVALGLQIGPLDHFPQELFNPSDE